MSMEIVASLIALAGVLISVVVSLLVNTRQTNIEIQKLRTEILQNFNSKLFEKRLEVYPDLYNSLSDFITTIQYDSITNAALEKLLEEMHAWRKYSILFSARTGLIGYELNSMLHEMTRKSDDELKVDFESPESRKALRRKIQRFELALKNELGIYSFESPTEIKEFVKFDTYQQVADSLRLNSKQ